MASKRVWGLCLTVLLLGGTGIMSSKAAPNKVVRILQTNSAGDNVQIIDPAINKVVGEITGIEVNHGVVAAPDGSRIYITCEAESTLDVADARTLKVVNKIPLSGHPNNLTVSPDGRRVYVAIANAPGGVDVIDTGSLKDVKTIRTKGPIHNPYVTPDGKFVVAGSTQSNVINVIDTKTEELAWTVQEDKGIRPMAFATNPDGSTKWIFVQLTAFDGFAVVDFAAREEIKRIDYPDLPAGRSPVPVGATRTNPGTSAVGGADPSHGLAVTSDGKILVANSRLNSALYLYSLPDLKLAGTVFLSGKGAAWVTLTPDGQTAYVSNAVTNDVSVVSLKSMKEITRIPVGFVPKRNGTGILQE